MLLLGGPASLRISARGGEIVGWGSNLSGQSTGVSDPGIYFATGLVSVAGHVVTNAVACSGGSGHSLALESDGTVVGWGDNHSGEVLGFQTAYPYRTSGPVRIDRSPLAHVRSISAGGGFSLAGKEDGTVVVWGLGLAEKQRAQVTLPPDLRAVVAVAAGWDYGMALKREGTVVSWGLRRAPESLNNIVAIAAGTGYLAPSLALARDGTVIEWMPGADFEDGRVMVTNATAIAAGAGHCLALLRNGTVYGWGANGHGEATGIPSDSPYQGQGLVTIEGKTLRGIVAIAAGEGHSLALTEDSTVVAWGRMNNGLAPASVPPGLSGVVAIAAGRDFCLAITTNVPPPLAR